MLLVDDNVYRNRWKLGKVIEIIPSSDGRVRRVKLQVKLQVDFINQFF